MDQEQFQRALYERSLVKESEDAPVELQLSFEPMPLDLYNVEIVKTVSPSGDTLIHFVEGVASESGELLGAYKKRWYGREIDRINVLEELGDLTWFVGNYWRLRQADFLLPKFGKIDLKDKDALGEIYRLFELSGSLLRSVRGKDWRSADLLMMEINWIAVELCYLLGATPEEVFRRNINKLLLTRYKKGFSTEASGVRDHAAERKALGDI